MPVDNNEHQRIDDVSTDRISYGIQSLETMGFALWRMNCLIVLSTCHNDHLSLIVVTCRCELHDLAMIKISKMSICLVDNIDS